MPSIYDLPPNEQDDLMSLAINPISPLKMKYINDLRERSKSLLEAYDYPEFITCDIELLRFVRGHMFNMDDAYEAFSKMLIWRKENNIIEYFKKVEDAGFDVRKLPYADVFEPHYHTNYNHKTDKGGRILDIRLLGSVNVKAILSRPLKEWMDYNIYILEWRIYILNKMSKETGILQRLCCIQDLKGVGMHMVSPTLISYFKEMSSVTSHNYPETMHKSFIVNAPGIFSSIWAIVKPMMHPRTVKKFIFLKSDYNTEVYKDISVYNLPIYLGGICHCEGDCICYMTNSDSLSIFVSSKMTMPIEVKSGNKVTWSWKLESGNIDVDVKFEDEKKIITDVYKGDRVNSHNSEFVAGSDGILFFNFDNSFSWLNGKTIQGMITVN